MIRKILLILMMIYIFIFGISSINELNGIDSIDSIGDIVIERGYQDTSSKNLVAAILIDYRLFDSVFEAGILIISVAGIIFMSSDDSVNKSKRGDGINER